MRGGTRRLIKVELVHSSKLYEQSSVEVQSQLSSLEDKLLGLREAISDLLKHIGPDTQLQSMDALLILMDLSFRAATFELQSGSLQAFLAPATCPKSQIVN